nr:MAG TPA: Alpha-lytic protease prodomain [Caudoviricetes sp.]
MKTKTIPYNNPALCVHYGTHDRCTTGWFHGRCTLAGSCIRCPKYESKTGLTYDIANDDEIVSAYDAAYFIEHVIASLKTAFAETPAFIYDWYVDVDNNTVRINDVADENCMLEFEIVNMDANPNKMVLKFLGRIKG